MLPTSYELPAAIVLVLGGALACFAGYRLFRFVLAIYGFILGAMLASSLVAPSMTVWMVVAAIVGGLVGAVVLMFAYLVGIALVGAGLGALVAHFAAQYFGPGDPPPIVLIVLAVIGAIAAMVLQRYVIIVATAFGGAWTLIVGLFAATGDRRAVRAAAGGDVWIFYPMNPAPGQRWVPIVWILLGLIGTGVQLGTRARKRG
ncbi:MAG: hypothetical protein DMF97_02985 [Acidobacteria bacterium]|nr:MAG: hypothetical protein DMF97_02985 [Acidobacteriota bacterium]